MPSASTFLIFLPTTSRSRSRRITSTSGSSGIGFSAGGVRTRWSRMEQFPCHTRGGLLGRLLRASLALAVGLAAQEHGGEEPLVVIRSLVAHDVARQLVDPARRELLESRLVVAAAGADRLLPDPPVERREHDPGGLLEAAVEEDRGDDGFHRVGEDRRLRTTSRGGLPLAEAQRGTEID